MWQEHYFYNCSREYIDSLSCDIFNQISETILEVPVLGTQSEINRYLFRLMTEKSWPYDSTPPGIQPNVNKHDQQRDLFLTSTTLGANWRADFANSFNGKLIQVEVQLGKVEAMFKDICGFSIAYYKRRLSLGIEIVMSEPAKYFSHRKASISGMAYFDIAKRTLPAIGLKCPIWLIGVNG